MQMSTESGMKKEGMYLGIDIGGTNIKYVVVKDREILYKTAAATRKESESILIEDVVSCVLGIREEYPFEAVGVGAPGSVIGSRVYADNIPMSGTPLGAILEKRLGVPVKVENDANCAALGELTFGGHPERRNLILITIGTGVGGGIILDGKLYRGRGAEGEIGHMIVQHKNGRKCACGQTGCFEQYASATALLREAKAAAEKMPDSLLGKAYEIDGRVMNGRRFFDILQNGCPAAASVLDEYTDWAAAGITSLINIFDPDAIVLSGGITGAGDAMADRIREKVMFQTPIEVSELQNDAGGLGAAMLCIA